jgi:hypothetical protein
MNANEVIDNEPQDRAKAASDAASASEPPAMPEEGGVDAAAQALHKAVIEAIAAKDEKPQPSEDSAPTLTLVPWLNAFDAAPKASAAKAKPSRRLDPLGIAASLAALGILAVGAFAGVDHMRQSALVSDKSLENQTLVESVAALKTRIETIEAARSQEQSTELRKTLAEVKSIAVTAQGYGASIGQMAQRVDRLEKDQNVRFDKLSERIDQSASARFGEIVARLDKLEKKPPAPAPAPVVALAAPQPSSAPAKVLIPPIPTNVSNEITGSIEKPKPVLRGYALEDIRDGMALIDGRDGPYSVSPGDILPGAGRVLKIERRGRDWVVVTSLGIITTPPEP